MAEWTNGRMTNGRMDKCSSELYCCFDNLRFSYLLLFVIDIFLLLNMSSSFELYCAFLSQLDFRISFHKCGNGNKSARLHQIVYVSSAPVSYTHLTLPTNREV